MRTQTKLALARIASRGLIGLRALFGRGPIAEVRRGGVRWRLDLQEGIDLSIYLLGAFERRVRSAYDRWVEPGDVVLDIGANIGSHTLPLARRVGSSGRVIAIEATDFAMEKLRAHLGLNPELARRVAPIQALLVADEAGSAFDIASSWPLDGSSDVDPLHGGRAMSTRNAEVTTLDQLLQRLDIERVDFVKLDTDGSEAAILAGAGSLLRRFRPTFLMEVAPYGFEPGDFERVLSKLSEHRFRLFRLDGRSELPLDPEALRAHIKYGAGINALAVPEEELGETRRRGHVGSTRSTFQGASLGKTWRTLRQRLVLAIYGLAARSGVMRWRPFEALFLRSYFFYKDRREASTLQQLRALVPDGTLVVDVGANCGFFTAAFAEWPVAQVIAVEPEATNFARLEATLRRRGIAHRVTAVRCAASDSGDWARLRIDPVHHGNHQLAEDGMVVETQTLDELVSRVPQAPVSLIKIDVQGAEMCVLRGTREIISQHRPAIYLEIDEVGLARFGNSLEDVTSWASEHGYVPYLVAATEPDGSLSEVAGAEELRDHIDATGEGYSDVLLLSRWRPSH